MLLKTLSKTASAFSQNELNNEYFSTRLFIVELKTGRYYKYHIYSFYSNNVLSTTSKTYNA